MRAERIKRLRNIMEEAGVDAILISDPANIFYLSGFSGGDDGKLLITPDEQLLLTDPRYDIQAKEESPDFELLVETIEKPFKEHLRELLKRFKIKKLGFEDIDLRFQYVRRLRKFKYGFGCRLKEMSSELEWFRAVKDKEELKIIEQAAIIGHESFNDIKPLIKVGAVEQDLAVELEYRFRKRGASGTSFPTIIASGPNGAKAHHSAGARTLQEGDLVVCDFGCKYMKYSSDQTNTIAIGQPSHKLRVMYNVVWGAHWEVIVKAKCGMLACEIDAIARDYIKERGYGQYFTHSTGHSLGLGSHENHTFHERPYIGPGPTGRVPVTANMVITVEPGIYIEGLGGVRIEGICVMTEDGLRLIVDDLYGDRRLEIF